jgi:YrbI family 3-deoxy-D-manno-octulosonate 8-phosphate phosphatase
MQAITPDIRDRCRPIRLLLLDVDGVLTSGGITYAADGKEIKTFHVRDGQGIKLWQRQGYMAGIISGRSSEIVKRRAAELGISHVVQGADNKVPAFERLLEETKVSAREVCYMGDDLPDVPLLRQAGFAATVADAVEEARATAHYVTTAKGGEAAVREVIELILKTQERWPAIVEGFRVP